MATILDDLTVAFAMQCDSRGMSYEQGIRWAEQLTDEIMQAAEDRSAYLPNPEESKP